MSNQRQMPFCELLPFVRYARSMYVSQGEYPVLTAAYDCRLFYVTKGQGEMIVANSTYRLHKGDLLFWQPGIPYRMDTAGDKTLQFIALNFDLTQTFQHKDYPIPPVKLPLFQQNEILEIICFTDVPRLNEPIYLQGMQGLEETLNEIKIEDQSKKAFFRERMSGLTLSIMSSIVRKLALGQNEDCDAERKIEQVILYIQAHYAENITNNDIGELFSYHPNYLNKLMVLYTKKSLHQYLISYRLNKAIDLIISTDTPLSEIAELTGFNDYCHFSKLFKKKTGINPFDFRRVSR